MKVALINDRLNAGGAEKVLVYIANLLHKNGIDVRVIIILEKAALDIQINKAIPVHYINRKSRFSVQSFKKLKQLVVDVDIVHVHSRYNLRYYMIAKFLYHINKPKIFFHEHVYKLKVDFITKYLLSKVDAYVAVQNTMKKWAIKQKIVQVQNAFYLSNTVSTPNNKIEINRYSKRIVMVANFLPLKNHFFAIDLMAKLPEDVSLDMYGMINDKIYFDELNNRIKELGLDKRITVIVGITNIYEVLSKYCLAIHPSKIETGPLVLIEYLNASIPFIAYRTGDVVEEIIEDLPDFVVPNFDLTIWKNKILNSFNVNDDAYNSTQLKIAKLLNDKFSENKYYLNLMKIYNNLLQVHA